MTTMNSRRNRSRRAFTLIELILAMGITLMVMFVAAYAISTTSGVASRADARMEVLTTGRTGLELLSADVAGAQLDSEGYIFQLEDGSYVEDGVAYPSDRLVLTCTPSEAFVDLDGDGTLEQSQTVRVYYFQEDTALVRYDLPADSALDLTDPNHQATVPRKALLYGVVSFSVQAYDGNAPVGETAWLNTWDSIYDTDDDGDSDDIKADSPTATQVRQFRRLPQFVRVTIEVQDTDGYMEIREDDATFELVRLLEVGTAAPAQ
jgi:type II secretory pathway pseudopilin PulG